MSACRTFMMLFLLLAYPAGARAETPPTGDVSSMSAAEASRLAEGPEGRPEVLKQLQSPRPGTTFNQAGDTRQAVEIICHAPAHHFC